MTSHPPLINMNANCVPTDPDLEHLVQAAYDTGHYAGNGQSGSNAHKAMMAERNEVWRKVATRLTAADALATKAEKLLELHRKYISTGYLVNEVFELDAALRKYREAADND